MQKESAKQALSEFLSAAEHAGHLSDVLQILLTYDEYEQVTTRLQIIKALIEGEISQREIASQYEVSIAKITRGSNMLKVIDPKIKTFLENVLTT